MKKVLIILIFTLSLSSCAKTDSTYEECLSNLSPTSSQLEVGECYQKYNVDENYDIETIDENSSNYENQFIGIDHIEKIYSPINIEGQYFIYLYTDLCMACLQIEDKMITFATTNQNEYKVYFMNVDRDANNGFSEFSEELTDFAGVPMIILIDNYQIKDEIKYADILTFLEEIDNDEYLIE